MNMLEIITAHGFKFDGLCSICKNRYKVFKNPEKKHVEIKLHVSGNYFKLFKPDGSGRVRQTAYGGPDKLEAALKTI